MLKFTELVTDGAGICGVVSLNTLRLFIAVIVNTLLFTMS